MVENARELAYEFYRNVEKDTLLRPLYPRHLKCPADNLARFLDVLAGGPRPEYIERLHMGAVHQRFRISKAERVAWLRCMSAAIEETAATEHRKELWRFFERAASQLVNTGPKVADRPAENELERRWDQVRAGERICLAAARGEVSELPLDNPFAQPTELLRIAAYHGRFEAMLALRERGATANGLTVNGALLVEIPEAAEMLLAWGASVDGRPGKRPPIVEAARGDKGRHPERLEALIGHDADVNARGPDGRTALHYAASAGSLQNIEILLAAGANSNLRDLKGLTPLDYAEQRGKGDVLELLRGSQLLRNTDHAAAPRQAHAADKGGFQILEPD